MKVSIFGTKLSVHLDLFRRRFRVSIRKIDLISALSFCDFGADEEKGCGQTLMGRLKSWFRATIDFKASSVSVVFSL